MRKSVIWSAYRSLIINSLVVAGLVTFLAATLKIITKKYEEDVFSRGHHSWWMIFFPLIGFTIIGVLRKYTFHNKPHKGMREVYNSLESRGTHIPAIRVISHYIVGFITVIFGGSTGIEVSTVVASATIGNTLHRKTRVAYKYKTEMISAAVAAAITTLFGSPLAGILFAIETVSRKVSRTIVIASAIAAAVSGGILHFIGSKPNFVIYTQEWHYRELPYILVLSILAGYLSVYLTRIFLFVKRRFTNITNTYVRISAGALFLGLSIVALPQLYGDSYPAMSDFISAANNAKFTLPFALTLIAIIVLKPIVASVTMGAGGDGGVFAPGLVIGALFGLLFAIACNRFLGTQLSPVNFMVVGMAAVLSGSIHAPFTSLALISALSGSYVLFFPIMIGSFISKFIAKKTYFYSVYSYVEPVHRDQQKVPASKNVISGRKLSIENYYNSWL